MNLLLFSCLLLVAMEILAGSAHFLTDNSLSAEQALVTGVQSHRAPSVVIVELPKTKKKKRTNKQRKNKLQRRPSPNCVALSGNCKTTSTSCCDFCAFCQCRLFRTICYCRMGNPRC